MGSLRHIYGALRSLNEYGRQRRSVQSLLENFSFAVKLEPNHN